jgi:plasmid replication initiation protein
VTSASRRRPPTRGIQFDRALEALPVFRLSDSSEDGAISYETESGGRWRVIPLPGDRLPGTFDQDVYFEVFRRFHDAGAPDDGTVVFTLHDFLRSMGRRVDGRTYAHLRAALGRLQRTTLESTDVYWDASAGERVNARFSILSSIRIERRRTIDREQLGLFTVLAANEPGDARVTIGARVRANIAAGHTVRLAPASWLSLSSPVSRRLYRMIAVAQAGGHDVWSVPLSALAEQLPLAQRYPSHLQRVLQPAHEMLVAAGVVREAEVLQDTGTWIARYVPAPSPP